MPASTISLKTKLQQSHIMKDKPKFLDDVCNYAKVSAVALAAAFTANTSIGIAVSGSYLLSDESRYRETHREFSDRFLSEYREEPLPVKALFLGHYLIQKKYHDISS